MSDQYSYHLFVKTIISLVFFLMLLSFNSMVEARLYKWVDENGQIKYGDQLPPEYNNKKHFQLDAEGRIVKEKKAGKSASELRKERELARQEAERKAKEEAELKKQQKEQARQDQILLLTFNSEDDIFYSRDQRLQVLDSKITLLNKNKESSQKKLSALQQQADTQYVSKQLEVPGGLQQKIEQQQRKIETTDRNINLSKSKRAEVISGFKSDLSRFRNLKARQRNKNENN